MTANQHTARDRVHRPGVIRGAPMAQAIGDSGFELHVWAPPGPPEPGRPRPKPRHTVHNSPASLAAGR